MIRTLALLALTAITTSLRAADYNIMDYGARNDTTVLSTQALQRAIDDCSRAGGGRVPVPRDNINLPGHPVENVWLSRISIHHKGGITTQDLPQIEASIRDEKEKDYPESTMWGALPAKGFFLRHTRNIHLSDVTVLTDAPDARPDFIHIDTE